MKNEKCTKYLFCYFIGNRPEEESVHFALSKDGYNFFALNGNRPVISQTLGKKCCRDPFIFRDKSGFFHIIATDMRSEDGWCSNNSAVIWDSEDLVNWKNERIIDFSQFEETRDADRVWAPEIIFDKFKNEYMIYWSHHNAGGAPATVIWHAYTKDFINLTTRPKLLFAPKSGLAGIDADIIEKDGKYYLYQADEAKSAVCYAVADKPDGPYFEPGDNIVSVSSSALEGNCIYPILGTNKYVLIADRFRDGGYFMQETTDMIHFREVEESRHSIDHLRPRHGSVLTITDAEYARLLNAFSSL